MTEEFDRPLSLGDSTPEKHRLSHKVYAGMWGKPEIVVVGMGVSALIATIVLFAIMVLPARKTLSDAKSEQSALEQQVESAREKYGKITTTEEQVARLVQSSSDFENAYLPVDSIGKTALYQRLNTLIGTHNLINTSGPEYTPLEVAEGGSPQEAGERGREKYRSIFPGVYVTMTVDGSYADIRRFISDIETSDQFVIISAIGIEPSEKGGKRDGAVGGDGNPTGPGSQVQRPQQRVSKGETVSLKIELAAYFRRQGTIQQ